MSNTSFLTPYVTGWVAHHIGKAPSRLRKQLELPADITDHRLRALMENDEQPAIVVNTFTSFLSAWAQSRGLFDPEITPDADPVRYLTFRLREYQQMTCWPTHKLRLRNGLCYCESDVDDAPSSGNKAARAWRVPDYNGDDPL